MSVKRICFYVDACSLVFTFALIAPGNCRAASVDPDLLKSLNDDNAELQERDGAVKQLAKTVEGAMAMIASARKGEFPDELKSSAALALAESEDAAVRDAGASALPLPKMKDGLTILPISKLVLKTGDVKSGRAVFRNLKGANCINCHQIENEGKDVGPPLNTIGEKPKEVLYESILAPSAAIQHGFETWSIRTKAGKLLTGMRAGEDDENFTLKTIEGEFIDIPVSEIQKKVKQKASLMPENLIGTMTTQELIDLVEYLASQKVQ